MDTKNFLAERAEIFRRMGNRRLEQSGVGGSPLGWLGSSLGTVFRLMTGSGANAATESILPKLLFPLAGPIAGALFGIARQKMFSTKKPLWMRFVPFL